MLDKKSMIFVRILIQLVSMYRAVAMFCFVLFHTKFSNEINSFILVTAILSDLLDGYLARRFSLTSMGGKLLDLFSDKYLNCISIIFLIIEGYSLFPLMLVLTKEIFILSFRSIQINGEFIIKTNRTLGGILAVMLWSLVFFHINNLFATHINNLVILLGIINTIYFIYKIVSNISVLKQAFKS